MKKRSTVKMPFLLQVIKKFPFKLLVGAIATALV